MGGQYATLKDVAERAGTTAATVSYVLNGSKKRYISEDMRRRVEEAARELNYVKSSAASSLKGKKRKIIAVLVPQFENQFFTQLILGVERVADQYGYILSICNTFDDPRRELEIINRMQAQRVDGYIITPTREGGRNTRQIRKIGVPMVVVDRSIDIKTPYFFVSIQNYESTAMAVRYLLERGHRHIAYIGWKADFGGLELREQAYRELLSRYQVPEEEQIVYNGEFTEESGQELTRQALKEHPEATAVLYAYNVQARGGVDYLAQAGIQVGKELSVLVIGAPDWVHTGNNRFTCVDLNGRGLGTIAAETLFDIIDHEGAVAPYQKDQISTLLEGDSVCRVQSV
ncbi:MAG: LacI family transcriptional regulator [Lachnospiraceae bacterium]|jgi:DNA-binding LacI/PurR family transcriptional regulator|nr:LacI family transcriptional regulator [Lachnospiraceae bacterium]MCI8957527.1 LacI family transcriptional regulator [Lachnospiraceae bacterium]